MRKTSWVIRLLRNLISVGNVKLFVNQTDLLLWDEACKCILSCFVITSLGGRSGNKLPTNKVDFMRAFNADLQKQNDNMEGKYGYRYREKGKDDVSYTWSLWIVSKYSI